MTWAQTLAAVHALIRNGTRDFDPEISNRVQALARAGEGRWSPPDQVGQGYWPTICLGWSRTSTHPAEIEVFPNRYELYLLGQGREFSVEEHEVASDSSVPPSLAASMDRLFGAAAERRRSV